MQLKMSPCYILRSLAIYIAAAIIFSESPVSAFTIQRTRTTTLRTSLDLTGQESALLEVRNDLPKINNEKGNVSQKEAPSFPKDTIRAQYAIDSPTRTSANALEVNKKSTESLSGYEVLPPNSANKEKESVTKLTTIDENENRTSIPEVMTEAFVTLESSLPTSEELNDDKIKSDITIDQKNILSTKIAEITTEGNHDMYSETLPATEASTTLNTKSIFQHLKFLDININSTESTPVSDTTISIMGTTVGSGTETAKKDNIQGETMTAEASSTITISPQWKTYTTIERKHTTSTEADNLSTEQSELLTKAETGPGKITLENAADYTPIPSLNELREELITNSKTYNTRNVETSSLIPSDPTTSYSAATFDIPSTSNSHTGPENIFTSKRAGFLDLNTKQTDSDDTTTTDALSFNETDLIGAMFEVELQESDSPDAKNESESQSQLAEDAIKEKLLEEQVLKDNMDSLVTNNKKPTRLSEVNESKTEPTMEDSLSVKPITPKNGLYTVSPNYKKMKKIEVQPLKPFIRDPDDNSWRNESLSLLGIVFKAKNASKPFTQVLKNKTEAELNSIMSEKDEKNEVTELRERLEKIAEVRKSRKKKINKNGDTVYNDYEEGTSSESTSTTPKPETTLSLFNDDGKLAFVEQTSPLSTIGTTEPTTPPQIYMHKDDVLTTKKPKKMNKFLEYYDTTDEYDADYVTLPKIDIKKFTTSFYNKDTATTPPMLLTTHAKLLNTYWPDRKPTVQYFPPRTPPKYNLNDYDTVFEKKVKMFANTDVPEATHASAAPLMTTPHIPKLSSQRAPINKPANLAKSFYATVPSRIAEPGNRFAAGNDESFNRASYVIKHFKDLIDEAVKSDYDKNGDYVQSYTEAPLAGITLGEPIRGKSKTSIDDDYDYVSGFRKDILNKFVENFNQNSERFKVDFPILYNSSVVHRAALGGGGAPASSTAFLKRQYGGAGAACEPHCDLKVELSPAYELHYYVPDQEEKEEMEPRPATNPYAYRL